MKFTASFIVSCLVAGSVALTVPIEARQSTSDVVPSSIQARETSDAAVLAARQGRKKKTIPCLASEGCLPADKSG
ncbi:hypothetical protein GGTG_05945 [Gaeumannomyces tritici R3-111a-1]|uniref:Uncharacterized protein n=1 Tax=Gaeumannomyces tritici (strain R3-111a-1) TaxID=644352 RepID=J3NXD9_GAET3|nr:hypothetical protein GGTG_05945 [Gaeumannomyces tritici R3-111a-1]EJT76021.1 hypothetical protein GGTG_05945 [Gaeumannomyces tritici R3-111a-1]